MIRQLAFAMAALIWSAVMGSLGANPAAPPSAPRFEARLAISPQTARVFAGASIRFHLVSNLASASDAAWSIVGPGSIGADGSFQAPSAGPRTIEIVATSGGRAASASVTVTAPPPLTASLAVVSCYDDGEVDVRDASGFSSFGTASAGDRSAGVAVDAARHLALVASGARLESLDLSTGAFIDSAEVAGARFSEVALLGGGFAAATDNDASAGSPGIRFFRVAAGSAPRPMGSAIAGDTPEGIAVTRDGRTLYVSNVNSNSVMRFAFDGRGDARQSGAAATGHRPFGIALDEAHHLLFVADNDTPTISGASSRPGLEVFSLPAMRRIARITTGSADALPLGVVVDAAANRAFVTNEGDGTVVAYSIVPLREVARASAGRTPWMPAIDLTRRRLYVPSALGDSFSVFDERSLKPLAQGVSTCGYPTSIAIADRP
jgi:sugar lactone lactonase YvrE